MFSLDNILASGEVLCKDFTIILIFFAFLCEIVIVHPNNLWLLLVIYLIEFYFFKQGLSIVILTLEARNKAESVRLYDWEQDNIKQGYEDDGDGGE